MKSSKSLFNKTLFSSNIKRFLPFCIIFAVAEFIIFPVIVYSSYYGRECGIEFEDYISLNIASEVFAFIFAGFFAIAVFFYLFTPNKCNPLHAFPIGRKALFATNWLSGYILLIVPQLFGFMLALPGIILFSKDRKEIIIFQLASIILFSLICYSFGVLAAMLSGHVFAAVTIYFILHFIYAAIIYIMNFAVEILAIGIQDNELFDSDSLYLSPVAQLLEIKMTSDEYSSTYFIPLLIYAAAAIVFSLIAYRLYKARRLECAGEMAAFKAELPVLRVIIAIAGAAFLSFLICTLLDFGKIGNCALYIFLSFIFYFGAEMALNKKFNIFKPSLFLRWFICCAVSLGLVWGIAQYQTGYIPEADKIESATLSFDYDIDAKQSEDVEAVRALHGSLIDYAKGNYRRQNRNRIIESYEKGVNYRSNYITIEYELKNGKTVSRDYTYYYDNDKIDAQIKALEEKNPYRNIFDMLDESGAKYTVTQITAENYTENDTPSYTVKPGDYDKFIALCRKDVESMTKNYSSLTAKNDEEIYNQVTIYCILDKGTDNETKMKLADDDDFIEGYLSFDGGTQYSTIGDGFEIGINLPRDSKAIKFLKDNY
jgi:ABC-2 type transport system permease protein